MPGKLLAFAFHQGHALIEQLDGPVDVGTRAGIMYRAAVEDLLPFDPRHETTSRFFVAPHELASVHYEWHPVIQAALDCALRQIDPSEAWGTADE